MRKLVKMMKQVNMIMLMMRSALGCPELGSTFDYRHTLLCIKPLSSLVALQIIKKNTTNLFSLAMDKTMSISGQVGVNVNEFALMN